MGYYDIQIWRGGTFHGSHAESNIATVFQLGSCIGSNQQAAPLIKLGVYSNIRNDRTKNVVAYYDDIVISYKE